MRCWLSLSQLSCKIYILLTKHWLTDFLLLKLQCNMSKKTKLDTLAWEVHFSAWQEYEKCNLFSCLSTFSFNIRWEWWVLCRRLLYNRRHWNPSHNFCLASWRIWCFLFSKRMHYFSVGTLQKIVSYWLITVNYCQRHFH